MLETLIEKDEFGNYELIQSPKRPKSPLVSVVMSVYNSKNYLQSSTQSILMQTFDNFEFIILDDGSTDKSCENPASFLKRDPRIVLIRNSRNMGLTKSLIRGIRLSQGHYIARQDVDDISIPQRLERQVKFFPKYDVVCCRTRVNAKKISPKVPTVMLYRWFLPFKNVFIHGTLVFKKTLYLETGGYDPIIPFAQDYDFMIRAATKPDVRIKYLWDVLYHSTKDKTCISIENQQKQDMCRRAISKKYRNLFTKKIKFVPHRLLF